MKPGALPFLLTLLFVVVSACDLYPMAKGVVMLALVLALSVVLYP
jgi:hypothetical protein